MRTGSSSTSRPGIRLPPTRLEDLQGLLNDSTILSLYKSASHGERRRLRRTTYIKFQCYEKKVRQLTKLCAGQIAEGKLATAQAMCVAIRESSIEAASKSWHDRGENPLHHQNPSSSGRGGAPGLGSAVSVRGRPQRSGKRLRYGDESDGSLLVLLTGHETRTGPFRTIGGRLVVNLEILNPAAALVTIVGLPLVLLSLYLSRQQSAQMQKAFELQACQAIYDKAIDVDMFFLEHISLKNLVYGDSTVDTSLDCDAASAAAACELMYRPIPAGRVL